MDNSFKLRGSWSDSLFGATLAALAANVKLHEAAKADKNLGRHRNAWRARWVTVSCEAHPPRRD